MYNEHFGLRSAPFSFTPSTGEPYLSAAHREGLAALEWGLLHEPTGFTLLVGEAGTGKTTLVCRALAQYRGYVRIVYVTNPRLSGDEMVRAILDQLGPIPAQYGKLELLYAFENYLDRLKRIAIIVDEAQDLSDETLEELRLLSNCARTGEHRLQLLLVGQPELVHRLTTPALRQLNQRVGARAVLNPLQPGEAYDYVDYLLRANGAGAARIFDRKALRWLIQHSGGIPRQINVLCHNAMVSAYSRGSRRVTMSVARAVIAEHENPLGTAPQLDRVKAVKRFAIEWARSLATPVAAAVACAMSACLAIYLWPTGLRVNVAGGRAAVPSRNGAAHEPAEVPHVGAASHSSVGSRAENSKVSKASRESVVPRRDTRAGEAAPAELARATQRTRFVQSDAEGQQAKTKGKRAISVQAGDTLRDIAIRYLGSDRELSRLIRANPQLGNINVIRPGQTVYLPAPDEVPDPNESTRAE